MLATDYVNKLYLCPVKKSCRLAFVWSNVCLNITSIITSIFSYHFRANLRVQYLLLWSKSICYMTSWRCRGPGGAWHWMCRSKYTKPTLKNVFLLREHGSAPRDLDFTVWKLTNESLLHVKFLTLKEWMPWNWNNIWLLTWTSCTNRRHDIYINISAFSFRCLILDMDSMRTASVCRLLQGMEMHAYNFDCN